MLIFLSSITSGEEEEEEEGEVVSGGKGDLYGYHHHPPPARKLSSDCISRSAVTAAVTRRPFYAKNVLFPRWRLPCLPASAVIQINRFLL